MSLVPLVFPPGLFGQGTQYQSKGRWRAANLMRFLENTIRPVGGWVLLAGTSYVPQTSADPSTPVEDAFTGGAGTLTGHTADTGEVWTENGESGAGAIAITLDGSGSIVSTDDNSRLHVLTAGRVISVTVLATISPNTVGDIGPSFSLFLRGRFLATYPTTYQAIRVQISRNGGPPSNTWHLQVSSESEAGGATFINESAWSPAVPDAEQTFVVAFNGADITVTVNGVGIGSAALAPDYDSPSHNELGIAIVNAGGTFGAVTIGDLSVTRMTTPGTELR